jgi:hypothetical protein
MRVGPCGRTSAGGGLAPGSVRTGSQTSAGESSASDPKNDDSRYACYDINGLQCYNCGLYGHYRRECRRNVRGKNQPNGIGKAN